MACSARERRIVSSGGCFVASRYSWSWRYFLQPPRRTPTMSTSRISPILASISRATGPHSRPGSLATASLSRVPVSPFSMASHASSAWVRRKSLSVSVLSAIDPPCLGHEAAVVLHGLGAAVDAAPQPEGDPLGCRPVRVDLLLADVARRYHAYSRQSGRGMSADAAPARHPEGGARGGEKGPRPCHHPGGDAARLRADGDGAARCRAHTRLWSLLDDFGAALVRRRLAHDGELEASLAHEPPRLVQWMRAQVRDREHGKPELHEDGGSHRHARAGLGTLAHHEGVGFIRGDLAAHAKLEQRTQGQLARLGQRLLAQIGHEDQLGPRRRDARRRRRGRRR